LIIGLIKGKGGVCVTRSWKGIPDGLTREAFGDLNPRQGPGQGCPGALEINFSFSGFLHAVFGALARPVRAIDVNLLGALGGLRKDYHAVRQDFSEPPTERQKTGSAAEGVHELAGLELRKKRRMPGKNAEISFAARDCHPDYLFVDHLTVRRHDLEVQFGGKSLLHKSA